MPSSNFLLVFSGTLFVYLGQRLYKIKTTDLSIQSERIKWMKANPFLVNVLLISSLSVFVFLASKYIIDHPKSVFLIGISAFISVFYVVKLGRWNLREIPFLKVFVIVSAYFILTIGLYLQYYSIPIDKEIVSLFVFIFSLTLLFDIPDLEIDGDSNVTFAQLLGVRNTILLSLGLTVLYFILLGERFLLHGQNFYAFWALVVMNFFINLPRKVNSKYYLAFYGEGLLGLLGFFWWVEV